MAAPGTVRAKGLEAAGGLETLALQCTSSVAATFIVQEQGQTLWAQLVGGVLITLVTAFLTAPAAQHRGRRIVLVALLIGLWDALWGKGEEGPSPTSPSTPPPPSPPPSWIPANWATIALAAAVGFAGGTGITAAKGDLPPNPHHVERVRVPVLHKQAWPVAEEKLTGKGLAVAIERVHSETVAPGHVVKTKPPAGSKPEEGTPITLIVSTGRFEVLVPVVVGWSEEDAAAKLSGRELRVAADGQHSETVPPGEVIATDPAGGEKVDKGALVTMTVSLGRREVTVPAVTGREEWEALSLLRDRSLEPRTKLVETTSSPSETVLYTDPPAGERVVRGSTVTVYVTFHEDMGCEEDFDTQEEAQRYFEELGGPAEDPDELDGDEDGVACE